MKLSLREQRIIDDLDHDLTANDPELAELFTHSPTQPLTFTDPKLADLYARLFGGPPQSRHLRLMRKIAERRRLRAP